MRDNIAEIKSTEVEILNMLQSCAARLSLIGVHLNMGGAPLA